MNQKHRTTAQERRDAIAAKALREQRDRLLAEARELATQTAELRRTAIRLSQLACDIEAGRV